MGRPGYLRNHQGIQGTGKEETGERVGPWGLREGRDISSEPMGSYGRV